MDNITGNHINGKWINAKSGQRIESINPAHTKEVLGSVPASDASDVDDAVKSARVALPAWSLMPAPKRAEILFRSAQLLIKHKDDLGRLVTAEMGKILPEGLSDVQEAIDIAFYMAGEGRRLLGETVPSELRDKDCKSVRLPIGVLALITPWNFPVAIPAWKIFPALISGNTVIFKPSSYTPLAATRLVEILIEAGLPPGVLNLIHGSGAVAGEALAAHPDVDGVSFTGSSAVGERLQKKYASLTKEINCEMGGKNPMIVMDDARIELAVEGALWGAFGTTGQRCTATSRVIVHKKIFQEFVDRFSKATVALRVGDGLEVGTDMGPLINADQLKKTRTYIKIGVDEGAQLTLDGRKKTLDAIEDGHYIGPSIFTSVQPSMRIATEEIFGPVVCLMEAGSLDEAINIANNVDYGLASSIYTQDVNNSAIAERDLDAGIVYINAPTIGAEIQLPFGGFKKSGIGHKEAGGRGGAIDMFTKWKVIYRDFSGRLQKAQIDD